MKQRSFWAWMILAASLFCSSGGFCADKSKADKPGFFGIFYLGVTTASVNILPGRTFADIVRVENLVPDTGLAVPVRPADVNDLGAGVTPFTFNELNGQYQAVVFNRSNYSFFRPILGVHIASRLNLELSLDWFHGYMNTMTADFPLNSSSAGTPPTGYYTHQYNDGAKAYTVVRMSSDLHAYSFTPTLLYQASDFISLNIGIIYMYTRGVFAAQSGWERNATFELYQSFPVFNVTGFKRAFCAGIKLGAYDAKNNKRSLFSSQTVKEMVGDISVQVIYISKRFGFSVCFDIYPFSDYAR